MHEFMQQFRIPHRENSYFTQCFMFEMNFVQVFQNFDRKTKDWVFSALLRELLWTVCVGNKIRLSEKGM